MCQVGEVVAEMLYAGGRMHTSTLPHFQHVLVAQPQPEPGFSTVPRKGVRPSLNLKSSPIPCPPPPTSSTPPPTPTPTQLTV